MDSPNDPVKSRLCSIDGRKQIARTAFYCVAALVIAIAMMFWRLGDSALTGDEATYAMIANTMRASGNWLDVTYLPGHPAYQKPPGYIWLTNLLRPMLGDSEIAYRAGSAGFGVGAVGVIVALAAVLFTPEVGLLAGLILLANSSYLLNHGARTGTFDTGLSFCLITAWLMISLARRGCWPMVCCVVAGVLFGAACLLKPLAGLPMLFLLSAVVLLPGTQISLRRRGYGIAATTMAMLLVAGPWYVAEIYRNGHEFINVIFWQNLVARSVSGLDPRAINGRWFYWIAISRSSTFFELFLPAMLFCILAAFRSPRRWEYASVVIVGIGWVAIFSVSVSKLIHYAYPVFPVIAMGVAVLILAVIDAATGLVMSAICRRSVRVTAIICVTVSMLFTCMQFMLVRVDRSIVTYRPWEIYKSLAPAMTKGTARIALVGFPAIPASGGRRRTSIPVIIFICGRCSR